MKQNIAAVAGCVAFVAIVISPPLLSLCPRALWPWTIVMLTTAMLMKFDERI